nr:MAG: ORF3 [Hubei mosquito virus 4]
MGHSCGHGSHAGRHTRAGEPARICRQCIGRVFRDCPKFDLCAGTLLHFEEHLENAVGSIGRNIDGLGSHLQEVQSSVEHVSDTIRIAGPHLGPSAFLEGIASLDRAQAISANEIVASVSASAQTVADSTKAAKTAIVAALASSDTTLVQSLDRVYNAVFAGLYEVTTNTRETNKLLSSLLDKGSYPPVAFPFGGSLLTNGGAYSYDSGSLYRSWRVVLREDTPAAIEQTYRLYVLSSNNVIVQYLFQFVSLPQQQGTNCVALIHTTNNGRWVLWRN